MFKNCVNANLSFKDLQKQMPISLGLWFVCMYVYYMCVCVLLTVSRPVTNMLQFRVKYCTHMWSRAPWADCFHFPETHNTSSCKLLYKISYSQHRFALLKLKWNAVTSHYYTFYINNNILESKHYSYCCRICNTSTDASHCILYKLH